MTLDFILHLRTLCGEWFPLPQEDREELQEAIQTGCYLTVWSQDQLVGFLSYKPIQQGAVWISQCYALSPEAFWHLVKQGRAIPATRIHFHRAQTQTWKHRRWRHALAASSTD